MSRKDIVIGALEAIEIGSDCVFWELLADIFSTDEHVEFRDTETVSLPTPVLTKGGDYLLHLGRVRLGYSGIYAGYSAPGSRIAGMEIHWGNPEWE